MSNHELTPEFIPATREQIDSLVAACNGLLSRLDVRSAAPEAQFIETYDLPLPLSNEIDNSFTPLPHDSDVLSVKDHVMITISHDRNGNIVPYTLGTAIGVKFLRSSLLSCDFWLPSRVCYELDNPSSELYKRTDNAQTQSMSMLWSEIQVGLDKSEATDPTLHAALMVLHNERKERQRHLEEPGMERYIAQIIANAQGQQEERHMGLQSVSYSEAEMITTYVDHLPGVA